MINIDNFIVLFFLLITLFVGIVAGKNIKNVTDYALANHRYGFIPLTLTFLATMVGGDDTTGDLAEFFENGIIYAIPYLAFIISIILVGIYIAPKIDKRFHGMISISDMVGYFYGKKISVTTAIIGCFATMGYATAQNIALAHLLSDITGMTYMNSVFLGGGVVVLYTIFGGIRSVVITDVLQFCILIIIVPIVCNVAITEVGGIINLIEKVPASHYNIVNRDDINQYIALFIIWVIPVNYFLPALMQRFLMARSPKDIRRICFIYAAILLALLLIMMSLSLSAVVLYPSINGKEIIPHIINTLLPIGIKGIAISGMIAVIMSTIDSNLNTSGIILTHNIIGKKNNELLYMRINTAIIGIISLLFALNDYNIIDVLVFVQVILSIGIGIPLAAALLGFKVKKRDFWVCLLFGGCCYVITALIYGPLSYITSFFTLITGLIAFLVSYFLHNKIQLVTKVRLTHALMKIYVSCKANIVTNLPNPIKFANDSMMRHGANYLMFGIFSAINYIVPYFMWPQGIKEHYALLLFMRIFAGILCIGLLLKQYWNMRYQKYFAIYWFFTLLYTLVIMPTAMFLVNNGLFEWLLNISLGIFILSMLVEWRVFLLLLITGVCIGSYIAINLLKAELVVNNTSNIFMGVYLVIFSVIVGLTFSRKRELSIIEKINYLSTLGSSIAHEMRTPLATINANLEILRGKVKNKDMTNIIDRIFLTTHRANNIINILLHNLKKEIKIKKNKESINKFVQETVKDFSMLEEESKWVTIEYSQKDTLINIDKFYAKYVIFNLLKNAFYQRRKYDKGDIKIIINNKSIIIKDTIIGISNDELRKIYDNTFTGEHEGTGLGLSFSKIAMESMGGTIECESHYLHYTKFTLRFL